MQTPPKLAQALIALSTPVSNRDPVLGDLAEEYSRRCKSQAPRSAGFWYWKQAILSFPYLIYGRLKASPVAIQILLTGISYLIFLLWMMLVFYIFQLIYKANTFKGSVVLALSVRLLIETTGYILAGALMCYGQRHFLSAAHKQNFWPVILMLIALTAPSILGYIDAQHVVMKRYLLARLLAIGPAVLIGYYGVRRITRSKH